MIFRYIYYFLPTFIRFKIRRIIYLPVDIVTYFRRKKSNLPPKGLCFIGAGNFEETGNRFAKRLIQFSALTSNDFVLDIGCGIGRLALPLTKILSKTGTYDGFDIMPIGINWCTRNISNKFSNFKFTHVNLANELYRQKGSSSIKFKFPYPDNHFTQSIAISVFTHLLPDETENYLSECSRVLKPGGKLYATFFLSPKLEEGINEVGYVFPYKKVITH